MQINTAISTLKALAQDSRMKVFRLLVRCGAAGLPAGKIAQKLSMNQTTLSRHLAMMQQVGLVSRQRHAQQIIYKVEFETARVLFRYLMEDCCAGDAGMVVDPGFMATNDAVNRPRSIYEGKNK